MVLTEQLIKKDIVRSVVTDIVLLGVVYYLPTISHLLAFPLYLLDPMRIVIFASILFSGNRINPFFLAFTIPVFSYLVGGHPIFLKSLLIGLELLANVAVFYALLTRGRPVFVSVFASILIAKALYYALKALLICVGWLNMELVSTPIYVQLAVVLGLSIVTTLLYHGAVGKCNNTRL